MVFCLEQGADLHMAKLMPLPLTVSCFNKIQIGFSFLVPAHPGCPGQRAVKRLCMCQYISRSTTRIVPSLWALVWAYRFTAIICTSSWWLEGLVIQSIVSWGLVSRMRCMNIVACTVQYHQLGSISCWQADIGVLPRDIRRTKLAWLFWTYLMRMGCRDNCKQVLKVIRQEAASLPHAYLRNGTHLRTQYTPHLSILFSGQRAVTCPPPKVPLGIWTIDSLSQHESAR